MPQPQMCVVSRSVSPASLHSMATSQLHTHSSLCMCGKNVFYSTRTLGASLIHISLSNMQTSFVILQRAEFSSTFVGMYEGAQKNAHTHKSYISAYTFHILSLHQPQYESYTLFKVSFNNVKKHHYHHHHHWLLYLKQVNVFSVRLTFQCVRSCLNKLEHQRCFMFVCLFVSLQLSLIKCV